MLKELEEMSKGQSYTIMSVSLVDLKKEYQNLS